MLFWIYAGFLPPSQPNKDEQNIIYDASSISEKQCIYTYINNALRGPFTPQVLSVCLLLIIGTFLYLGLFPKNKNNKKHRLKDVLVIQYFYNSGYKKNPPTNKPIELIKI